jgi:hypothetical protein
VDYRLLVDLEVIAVLDPIPNKLRKRILAHFVRLRTTPDQYSDFQERDRTGWQIEITFSPATQFITGLISRIDTSRFWR